MKLRYTILFICLLTNGVSQNLSKLTVEIDVRSGAFSTTLPFDESFTIKGELGYSTKKVILKYGPLDEKQEKNYFVIARNYTAGKKKSPVTEYTKEYIVKTGETDFTFSEVGPLRPNIPYQFKFVTLSQNRIDQTKINFLRQALTDKFRTTLTDRRLLGVQDMDEVYDDLIATASGYMGDDPLVNASSEPFTLAAYKKELNLFSFRFLAVHSEINRYRSELTGIVDSVGANNLGHNFDLLLPKLAALNAGSVPLSVYAKRSLQSIIDRNYQDGRTLGQPLAYLQSFVADKNQFRRVALGSSGANAPEDSLNLADMGTLENLVRIVEVLSVSEFTKADNSRVFTTIEAGALQEMLKSLTEIRLRRNKTAESTRKLYALRSEILDALLRAYTDESFVLASAAEFEVVPKHGPYVSLDAGVLVAYNPYRNADGRIGNSTYFSIYEGINIYFAPVNKRVPLRSFKWPYRFFKAFNAHIGIANFSGNYDTYRLENSFGRLGNVVVGVGLRFNSVTKIGLNTMLVNMRDINPTISRSRLMPMLSGTLSFDINVVGALQNRLNRRSRSSP